MIMVSPVFAQRTEADSAGTWKSDLLFEIAGSQAGFQNWVEGGTNSLSGNLGLTGVWERQTASWTQRFELRFRYGVLKQDTLDFRKAEDEIYLLAEWSGEGEDAMADIHPTLAVSFRSQFTEGLNYETNPFDREGKVPIKVSSFLSPGTFQETFGIVWSPESWFSQHLGLASKQTIVLDDELRGLYGSNPGEMVRVEFGVDATTRVDVVVAENVRYKTMLGLFAAFNTASMPDTRWDNTITMRVNAWLRVTLEWVVLFDADVSNKAQFRETFGIGLSYAIL